MTTEDVLRLWGRSFGQYPPADAGDEEPEAVSSIGRVAVDRSREPQVIDARERALLSNRAAVARRRIQAMVGDACRVPVWAGGDPIRCKATNEGGGNAPGEPLEAERVERVVLALYRLDRRAALALRAHYCLLGRRPLSERIAAVCRWSDTHVSRVGYRAALARGRMHVEATISQPMKKTG